MTEPYFMVDGHDPRKENRNPKAREVTKLDLAKINVEMLQAGSASEDDFEEHLSKLAKIYCMQYRDQVDISRKTMKDFDAKLKMFYTEHLHKDPEVRFIKQGRGYFDVRSENDQWIRIPVTRGDFVFLPAGLYHRFTCDQNDYVVAVRLFQSDPKWKAYNRTEDGDEQAERDEFLRSTGLNTSKIN